eukprot:s836_g3.t1
MLAARRSDRWRWRAMAACAGICSVMMPRCRSFLMNSATRSWWRPGRGLQPTARHVVNEAGFEVGVTMSPEEADRLGLKPFGDGGAENETSPRRPKLYTHGPCRSAAAAQFVVPCLGFEDADEAEQRRMAMEALEKMRRNGFVVLESLLPTEWVRKLEAEAQAFLDLPQEGLIPQPLRAGRTEGHLAFTAPWASDWLLKNDLILEVVAGYMTNMLAAGRTQAPPAAPPPPPVPGASGRDHPVPRGHPDIKAEEKEEIKEFKPQRPEEATVLGHQAVMPPKLRRPAAAPKVAARAPGRRLRRPAGGADEEEKPETEVIEASKVTLAQCKELEEIEVLKGSYWEAEVRAALRVREVTIKQGELFLKSQVLGTQSEALLRAASNRADRMIEAHLCPLDCTGGPHVEGVMHIASFRKLGREREAWMSNMIPEERRLPAEERDRDELDELREDMRRLQPPQEGGQGKKEEEEPPSGEEAERRKKKRKKSRSRQRRGKDWKVEAQKDPKVLFQSTGVDPDPAVRKKFRKKAAKLAKRKARESKGSSSTSSSSSADQVGGDATLFSSSSKTQVIGRRLPGALAASAVDEISEALITAEGGLWNTQEGVLPPLWVRYYRHQLGGRMAPPMARETLTLCYALDLLLRGRPAETLDVLSQRVKALELQAGGVHYTVSQMQELLPREGVSISTTPELYEAARRAREEGKVRADAARPYGSRSAGGQRADETAKGWNKKGSGKAKGSKGEPRKNEGDKPEKGKPKGSEDAFPLLAPGEGVDDRELLETQQPHVGLKRCGSAGTPVEVKLSTTASVDPDRIGLGLSGAGEFVHDDAPFVADVTADLPAETDERSQHHDRPAKAGNHDSSGTGGHDNLPLFFSGKCFFEVGGTLYDALQQFQWCRHSKAMTMAEDHLFPLPLGAVEGVHPDKAPWMCAILQALNSLYGCSGAKTLRATEVQKKLILSLAGALETMWGFEERVPTTTFGNLFDVVGVDYKGEEIKLAKHFSWECIAGALPKEVGTLDLSSFCTGGCRHYVEHFESYLLPGEYQVLGRTPRIMVHDSDWYGVCNGLIKAGICKVMPRRLLHHVGDQPLLNGLFAVSKNEFDETGLELHRLIMNMVPVNRLCRSLRGDVGTLPTVAGLTAFYLEEGEVAMLSSEDIKCFYYLFRVPESWHPFMGFARTVPPELVPEEYVGEDCHLLALVLPMGFLNSVGIAQHVHRNVVRWSLSGEELGGSEQELRRDRPAPNCRALFRVYLDNWDQIRKVDSRLVAEVEGQATPAQLALRQQYLDLQIPRHPKKSVQSLMRAEIQGALLDGREGTMCAKPDKILKYLGLGWELVQRGHASLRELQVVAGGFVYITMFRRPPLCSLNEVWVQIEALKHYPPVVRLPLPREVKLELVRFMCLIPLAQLNFRLPMETQVTASDASSTGGGISCSVGLTDFGVAAQKALVRGEFPEPLETIEVLTVGLFDGIGALRVAADLLLLPMAGHISVECNPYANRVLESAFPGSRHVEKVQDVTAEEVTQWACEYSSAGIVLVGAGPPCQGVSQLNYDRKGSQRDARSSLYKEIPRVVNLIKQKFPWAQGHVLVESVASMDAKDRAAMSEDLGMVPNKVDSAGISLARRPRLYWVSWEICQEDGLTPLPVEGSGWLSLREIELLATIEAVRFLQPGWFVPPGQRLATFTTSRPSPTPGRRPAGIHSCSAEVLAKWREDLHRYPPYQYKPGSGGYRVASVLEREVILGFPAHYTEQCVGKAERKADWVMDVRKTLLGNSWSVPVVTCLIKQLFERLGVVPHISVQELVDRVVPGGSPSLQSVLQRPPIHRESSCLHVEDGLARRLSGLVSIKGEDLLLQATTEQTVKYHRLRSSIPSRLWKWKEVSGWAWKTPGEHINQLEMRAILTSVKYWILKRKLCKKHLEGRSQKERQQVRKSMGTLKQLTLQPKTRERYTKAKARFYAFLNHNSLVLPREYSRLDSLLCDYLEHLWATGEGRALASDTLAALQDTSPKIRGSIPGAWRLLRTWHVHEIPSRAPPLPERVLKTLAGYFIFKQEPAMALSVLLGFYAMLRTGELLGVRSKDVTIDDQGRSAVISLGLTKGGKRTGAAESVTVTVAEVIRRLRQWKRSEEQQWALVQWLTSGASLDWFLLPEWGPKRGPLLDDPPAGCSDVGEREDVGPFFGRISLIRTPPGSEPQKHHRDINFPGPAAQVTAQVALTQLEANNGPLAYVPGSHRMVMPGFEVVANPPLGSVVLYDSFCEHRGIEHHGNRDRYAMYYEFETRGVFSGYTASHFGPSSGDHMKAFRAFVDPELRKWVERTLSAAPAGG